MLDLPIQKQMENMTMKEEFMNFSEQNQESIKFTKNYRQ